MKFWFICWARLPGPEGLMQRKHFRGGSALQLFANGHELGCTYLCCDHDNLQDLDSQLPGNVSSGPVLLTRAHEVVPQVISQLLLVHHILSHDRTETHKAGAEWRRETPPAAPGLVLCSPKVYKRTYWLMSGVRTEVEKAEVKGRPVIA